MFITDLVRLWVTAHPTRLRGQVDVQAVFAGPDKNSVFAPLIDAYLMSMGYKRPAEWFKQLQGIVSILHLMLAEIGRFAEFEATRDVFVHNRSIA